METPPRVLDDQGVKTKIIIAAAGYKTFAEDQGVGRVKTNPPRTNPMDAKRPGEVKWHRITTAARKAPQYEGVADPARLGEWQRPVVRGWRALPGRQGLRGRHPGRRRAT